MKELEMIYSKLIPTDEFGDLKIKCIILEYDYPRCFISVDSHNQLYALLENNDDEDDFGWNVTKVSAEDINFVNKGEKNIQSLFIGKDSFILTFKNNASVGNVIPVDSFEGEYEIKGNLFVSDFCEMEELFDYHKLLKISKVNNKSSLSLLLESNTGANTGIILKIIGYIKSICKNLKNSLDITNSNLFVQHGSTVITFEFENTISNTIFYGDISQEINTQGILELGNVLSANEPEQILSETNDNKAIQKYSKMIETFETQAGLRPKLILAIPQKESAISFDFGKRNAVVKKDIVDKALKMYSDGNVIIEDNVHIEGILTGILTGEKNQFTFKDFSGNTYRGTVDFSLLGNQECFMVNGAIYNAKIKKTIVKNNDKQIKISYKLMNIEKKEDITKYNQIKLFD